MLNFLLFLGLRLGLAFSHICDMQAGERHLIPDASVVSYALTKILSLVAFLFLIQSLICDLDGKLFVYHMCTVIAILPSYFLLCTQTCIA